MKSLLKEPNDTERAIEDDFDNARQNDLSLEKFQRKNPEKKVVYYKEDVDISTTEIINTANERKLTKKTYTSFPLNVSNLAKITREDIDNLKEKIKKIDWKSIDNNWTVKYKRNSLNKEQSIQLNPYEDCSSGNPLYLHKGWLNHLYTNLGLSDPSIGQICGLSSKTINKWRNKLDIQTKKHLYRWVASGGYIELLMPPEYRPPYINYLEHGRVRRKEHTVIMENHLKKYPELSRKYLIDGKYLKPKCEIHHINLIRFDNRIENLWLYANKSEHSLSKINLNESLSGLIKLEQIYFDNGKYYLKIFFDYRLFDRSYIEEIIKSVEVIDYENLDKVSEALKQIDWNEVSDNWTIQYRVFGSRHKTRTLVLNPYSECSSENPLYMHKGWVEHVVNNKRFNMTDSRLGELCNVSEMTAYRWRWERHQIHKYDNHWGKYRRLKRRTSGGDHIYIKLPKNYNNPFARKLRRHDTIAEHRYIMERYLAQHPEWETYHKCLLDGKYLLPDCIVHHINLDTLDNRLENLWLTTSHQEHNLIHNSLTGLVKPILELGFLVFEKGKYQLNY